MRHQDHRRLGWRKSKNDPPADFFAGAARAAAGRGVLRALPPYDGESCFASHFFFAAASAAACFFAAAAAAAAAFLSAAAFAAAAFLASIASFASILAFAAAAFFATPSRTFAAFASALS